MNSDEFVTIAKGLKAAYSQQNFLADAESMKLWYSLLSDLPYQLVNAACMKHIMSEKFPPTISEIREKCAQVTGEKPKDFIECWGAVCKAIGRYGFYRPEEALRHLEAFDEKTAQVVRNMGWQSLCMSENPAADRANFRQSYETMQKREHDDAKLPTAFRTMLDGIGEKLSLTGGNTLE